ncbi:MAG: GAF domain-containing protein [Anaerolineaceae bacterium]|nr:GAF domain-containing protein [Anaerolineaceae bacterium]
MTGLLALQSYQKDAYSQEEGEWLSVAANQIGLSIQNARLFSKARQRLAELTALHSIDFAVTAHLDREKTLAVVLDQAMLQLGADAVDILLLDPQSGELSYAMGLGFITQIVHHTSLTSGNSPAEKAVAEKRTIQMFDLRKDAPDTFKKGEWAKESFGGYIGVPLIAEGKIIGVMEVFQRSVLTPDADWLRFLELLAGQAAIAVDQIQLFDDIKNANAHLLQAYDATIEGWSQAMDLRDKETEGHTQRVTQMTMTLAKSFGYHEDDLVHIRRGALLHDIGKLGVPDHILFKPGPLSPEEWITMRKHPLYAYQMLVSIKYLAPALDIPYCHHEKWDGSGYPRGLAGPDIPLAARIFAIVDVWDALSNDRPYRPAWSQNEVLAYLEEQSGTHFDPQVVAAFLKLPGLRELNG